MSLPWRFNTVEDYVQGTIARLQQASPTYRHLNVGKYFLCRTDELSHHHLQRILEAAQNNPHIDELMLSGIPTKHGCSAGFVALSQLSQLLRSRQWKRVIFMACEGEVITAALDNGLVDIQEIRLSRYETLSACVMVALQQTLTRSTLRHLVLSEVVLSHVACNDILPLVEGIAASSSLEILEINYCILNDKNINSLSAHGLCKNTSLVALHMPGCEMDDEAVRMVVEGISHHPKLKTLKLFRNHCGERGVQALAKVLLQSNPKDPTLPFATIQLETLDLSYQQFERQQKLNVDVLAKSLAHNTTLKNLILAFNKLNDTDAICLAEGLHGHPDLAEIDLRANNIRDAGAVALAEKVLSCSPKLRKFCLYGNPLGEIGGHSVLAAIQANTEVETINMDYGMPAYDKIHYYAYLNQVGRRLMKEEDFNPALWPIIIERARRTSLETRGVCTAADLIYPFVRESTMLNRGMDLRQER
ncbi:leucine rich repeat LRR-containing protein [Nitzschia inconspicua]|uniref:Leucine rich repeat LRR-containing protein n=1 Tax=Nitzschia inconspicua TaxID=303405 RepID=A0A9K3M2H9_9STRA|nr:leucine rich repeat LRR-containing protein [Nitzschia inconspicua]